MRINILDSSIFNKIAAGEVVEKPASVVKELVENSIDAGATNITIEVVNGGIDMIKITDNGIGMDKEDLKRALLPHATSKIRTIDDLSKIGTLGFRGEALASISAVADIEIISKTENDEGGMISCKDTIISEPVDMGSSKGTIIIVTDLFKNIPARRKFLRKPKAEENDITSYVEKLILSSPQTAIRYIVNDKVIYNSTGNNLKEAIYVVYGKQVLDNLMEVKLSYGQTNVYGFISKPTYSKPNRNYQTLICNGRYIVNQQISMAMSNAYSDYMMKGQFPFYVMSLTLPVDEVDVNVHPNKLEVRFVNKQQIFSIFYNVAQNALIDGSLHVNTNDFSADILKNNDNMVLTNDFIKNSSTASLESMIYNKTERSGQKTEQETEVQKVYDLFDKGQTVNEQLPVQDTESNDMVADKEHKKQTISEDIEEKVKAYPKEETMQSFRSRDVDNENDLTTEEGLEKQFNKMLKKSFEVELLADNIEVGEKFYEPKQKPKEIMTKKFTSFGDIFNEEDNLKEIQKPKVISSELVEPETKIIGTCFNTYILVQKGDLFIIDQHAGHERLLYDELTKMIDDKNLPVQPLLLPYVFSVDSAEIDFIEKNIPVLEGLGFEISQIGKKEFSINAVPMILNGIDLKGFVDNLLKEMPEMLRIKNSDLVKDKLKSMSCRKAIKAGHEMSVSEIELLLKMTDERNTALLCPHGRPSVIRVTKHDLEKWFKRAV